MSQFNPTQFGGIMSPGAQMQSDLANQYQRDQTQMNFLQQQGMDMQQQAAKMMMSKIFGDIEERRLEREKVKGMIGRIHRAASLLGDYDIDINSLGQGDMGLGSGRLSDLLEQQNQRLGGIQGEIKGLNARAATLNTDIATSGNRVDTLMSKITEDLANIDVESSNLAFSSARRSASEDQIISLYGDALQNFGRGGWLGGTFGKSREKEQRDPATRLAIAIELAGSGVNEDLGRTYNGLIAEGAQSITRRPGDLENQDSSYGLGRFLRGIGAGIMSGFQEEEGARKGFQGQEAGPALANATLSFIAEDMLQNEDGKNPVTAAQRDAVMAILQEVSSDSPDQAKIAALTNGPAGDVRRYVRDILASSRSVLDQLRQGAGTGEAGALDTGTATSLDADRKRRRALGSAMSTLSAMDTELRQDIVLTGQGKDGTDIRLRGVTDPREDLMEIRESLITAIESNTEEDIAEALSKLPNAQAEKIESMLLGLEQAKDQASGFRTEAEDIAEQIAELTRDEQLAGARAGEQAGALQSLRGLEGDLLAELATFERLGN
jgi:hypothetical protein